nr:DEAD-box ATP-dependent RNA helicase [Paratrimastix eleionoma]
MEKWETETPGEEQQPEVEKDDDDNEKISFNPDFSFGNDDSTLSAQRKGKAANWIQLEQMTLGPKAKQKNMQSVVEKTIHEILQKKNKTPAKEQPQPAKATLVKKLSPTPVSAPKPVTSSSPTSLSTAPISLPKLDEAPRVPFSSLGVSKPILRALVHDLGYETATPIQAQAIPHALNGLDLLASAVTGSGKTAAFSIPILERLLQTSKGVPQIRALVLSPTRELAIQTVGMMRSMAAHTELTVETAVGGLPFRQQEALLRQRPDIVAATPGRLIDLIDNCPGITLENLEILVLDEADRLLDLGFKAELEHILSQCPAQRQTMLFSATMTDDVAALAALSLKKPVRVAVDREYEVAPTLIQEIVEVKNDDERDAILLSLCERTFNQGGVVIFAHTRERTHQLYVLLKLAGLLITELHGGLTQSERLYALEAFREGTNNSNSRMSCKYLVCTDLVARGLDIEGLKVVISYDTPRSLREHIHRAGRTARAGNDGRCVTFIEKQTLAKTTLIKDIVSHSQGRVLRRVLSPSILQNYLEKLQTLTQDVDRVMAEEKVEKEIQIAERDAERATNRIVHADEIEARPQRTWFESTKQRKQEREQEYTTQAKEGKEDEPMTGRKHGRDQKVKEEEEEEEEEDQHEEESDDEEEEGNEDEEEVKKPKKMKKIEKRETRKMEMKLERGKKSAQNKRSPQHDDDMDGGVRASIRRAKKSMRLGKAGAPGLGTFAHQKEKKERKMNKKKASRGGKGGEKKKDSFSLGGDGGARKGKKNNGSHTKKRFKRH